jgi:hypothetical protein
MKKLNFTEDYNKLGNKFFYHSISIRYVQVQRKTKENLNFFEFNVDIVTSYAYKITHPKEYGQATVIDKTK